MLVSFPKGDRSGKANSGFTLAEIVIAMAVLAIVIQGVVLAYIQSARRAEWNGRSLAAQALASQGIEQARAAAWRPLTFPRVDELGPGTNMTVETLDIPVSGQPIFATNFVSISIVSTNPFLRRIRADCVWGFVDGRSFTNTMITLRAPDQ